MADEIKQIFSIDVQGALQALTLLDTGYKNFATTLGTTTDAIRKFNRSATTKKIDALATSFNNINTTGSQANVKALGSAIASNVKSGTSNVGRLTASLETLSRVTFTQFIVRGLSQIRNALRGAVKDSVDFQKQIALVETIDNSGTGFDKLASDARQISKSLGVDQVEVAAGAYQSLGNQVGTTAESFKLLEVSTRFAESTGSTTAQAVDLLSGTLKAYNLTVDDAESVAGKFFVALDKGRLTSSELANTMGRTNAIAATLGVTIDEQNAFLSASTVTGTKAAESITQLRAIMSAFIKPSKAMSETLKKLGFDSGEAAIRALGFRGAVIAVSKASGGTAASLGKIFPNVRALTGVVAGLNSQSKIYNETLRESQDAVDLLGDKYAIVAATDAKKFEKATNAISTAFSESFGDRVLKAVGLISDFAGGAESLSRIGTVASSAVDTIGISIAILGARSLFASQRAGVLLGNLRAIANTPIGAAGTILALAPLASDLGNTIGKKLTDLATKGSDEAVKAGAEEFNTFKRNEKQKTAAVLAEVEKRTRASLNAFRQVNALEANASPQFQKSFQNPTRELEKTVQSNQKIIAQTIQRKEAIILQTKELEVFQKTAADIAEKIGRAGANEELTTNIKAKIAELSQGPIDNAKLAELLNLVQELQEKSSTVGGQKVVLDQVRSAATLIQEAALIQAKLDNTPSVSLLDATIQAALQGITATQIQADAMNIAIQQGASGMGVQAEASRIIAENYERAAAAALRLQTGSGSAATNRMFGGSMSYFASGGRGLDTIPAMLSKGEFVVNAKSSQRFFSQIQAMNAGQNPVFRQDGGGVTNNTNIGDINVNGSKSPEATAKAIVSLINRAQRRGLAKIR
jgi:TP901 family phage tail tape measure protein